MQFDIQTVCRQEYPDAFYLFIVCANILLILIMQNKEITGIFINNKGHKISQYADDTISVLNGSLAFYFKALETIDFYCKFSGRKIIHLILRQKSILVGSE